MKPLVYLLPGLLCDAFAWGPQIEALDADFTVRVADFTRQDSIGGMARTILDEEAGPFFVVGHSMGGRVAVEVARQSPGQVRGLSLLDTGAHPTLPGEFEKRMEMVVLAEAEGMTALARRWLPPMVHPDRVEDPAIMPGLTAMVERMSPAIYRSQTNALLTRPDAFPALRQLRCPVLIGVGRQDSWSPPSQHEAIASAIPQARYVVFEDSGHMAPVERPDAVCAALLDWLQEAAVQPAAAAEPR